MRIYKFLAFAAAVTALSVALSMDSFAQGRGNGGNRGGGGNTGGRPDNPGMDRGRGGDRGDIDRGRPDDMFGRRDSRTEDRMDPAKRREMNRQRAMRNSPDDNELNRYRGISKKLGVPAETLRDQYIAAATLNPDLKFGQFVAANVVADNLNGRYPNVTPGAILLGLQNGDSIGRTLRDLRVDPETAKRAEKDAKRQMKEMMPKD